MANKANPRGGEHGPRILFLPAEFLYWLQARSFAYTAQLAFEEGFEANGATVETIPFHWWAAARDLVKGRTFDQVWVHPLYFPTNEGFKEWVTGLAPVRVGLLTESLGYTEKELSQYPVFARHAENLERWLPHLTHVLAVDETDVISLRGAGHEAMWWVTAVPERFVARGASEPALNRAIFIGALYGERMAWLARPDLRNALVRQPSPERFTTIPAQFGSINILSTIAARAPLIRDRPRARALHLATHLLRMTRRNVFARYLERIRLGAACVNLPSAAKTYPGRVVEAMAAGRPVISWKVPDRPRNAALFEDGTEILLYTSDDPGGLARHIDHVLSDPEYRRYLEANAREKILRYHTIERRVGEVFRWVADEALPSEY